MEGAIKQGSTGKKRQGEEGFQKRVGSVFREDSRGMKEIFKV